MEKKKLDFIKANNFASKDIIKKMKRPQSEFWKIFANPVSDKGILSRIYKDCLQLSNRKTTWLKMGIGLE